jgi:hypothetical protein
MVNLIDSSNATYSINYTPAQLRMLAVEMTGDTYDTELEFRYDTVQIKRTRNPIRRWWGNFCADIVGWALIQNEKHGDYYMLLDEEYSSKKIVELEAIELGED